MLKGDTALDMRGRCSAGQKAGITETQGATFTQKTDRDTNVSVVEAPQAALEWWEAPYSTSGRHAQ